jgi:hypothetical protein
MNLFYQLERMDLLNEFTSIHRKVEEDVDHTKDRRINSDLNFAIGTL